MHINPDHFLETAEGRVVTSERNARAWEQCFLTLHAALKTPVSGARLYVLVGAQGSGKSTWARQLLEREPSAIVFDAILVKRSERAPILAAAHEHGVPAVAVWLRTPLSVCIRRNADRPLDQVADEQGLRNVFAAIEAPTPSEGFTDVVEVAYMNTHEREELLQALKGRFEKNTHRHEGIAWADVRARLMGKPDALASLRDMEATGGEPDVIGQDGRTGQYMFCDCAAESPSGRRSLCYDREALESRKENKPQGSAVDRAAAMGIDLLTEEAYRQLQKLGEFDVKTSSWVSTPPEVRALGGALFCDRRYGRVFVYHNGAQSYYAARGFRGSLRV